MDDLNPVEWAILPLKKYADFSGRAPRAEYWWFYLGTIVAGFIMGMIQAVIGTDLLGILLNLALLLPTIAVGVRRLHDTDRSGLWLLSPIPAIAVGGLIVGLFGGFGSAAVVMVAALPTIAIVISLFVFMILPGNEGSNRFGPDPYGGSSDLEEVFA